MNSAHDFNALYGTYAGAVRSRCRAICGNAADADEACQETFLRAWRARDRFDGRHPLAWLQVIGRNTSLELLRKRRPWVDDPVVWLKLADKTASDPSRRAEAARVLDGFQPEDAAMLRLRHAEGWRIHEIAEHLGTSSRTVRRRIERLEQRCRALFQVPEVA